MLEEYLFFYWTTDDPDYPDKASPHPRLDNSAIKISTISDQRNYHLNCYKNFYHKCFVE